MVLTREKQLRKDAVDILKREIFLYSYFNSVFYLLEVICKKAVVSHFSNVIGKQLYRSISLQNTCFLLNFEIFFWTAILYYRHLWAAASDSCFGREVIQRETVAQLCKLFCECFSWTDFGFEFLLIDISYVNLTLCTVGSSPNCIKAIFIYFSNTSIYGW